MHIREHYPTASGHTWKTLPLNRYLFLFRYWAYLEIGSVFIIISAIVSRSDPGLYFVRVYTEIPDLWVVQNLILFKLCQLSSVMLQCI